MVPSSSSLRSRRVASELRRIQLWRATSLWRFVALRLRVLRAIIAAVDLGSTRDAIEVDLDRLLLKAISRIEDENFKKSARSLFGCADDTKHCPYSLRMQRAAEDLGVGVSDFRNRHRHEITSMVTESVWVIYRNAIASNRFTPQVESDTTWTLRLLRMGKRTLSLLIAVSAAFFVFAVGPFSDFRNPASPLEIYSVGGFVVLCGVGRLLLSRAQADELLESVSYGLPSKDDDGSRAIAALEAFHSKFSARDALQYSELYADPGSFLIRGSERVELETRSYSTSTTWVVSSPEARKDGFTLVPVLKPKKGALVDNLRVSVDKGISRTLSYREAQGLQLSIARSMIESAFGTGERFPSYLWNRMRLQIMSDSPASDSDQQVVIGLLDHAASALDVSDRSSREMLGVLTRFTFEIMRYTTIICVVPSESLVKLKVEYTETKSQVLDQNPSRIVRVWEWAYSYIFSAFGLGQRSHIFTVQQASMSQSYHFTATAPDGMYVYDIAPRIWDSAIDYDSWGSSLEEPARAMDPMWAVSDSRGLKYIHAYGRDLDSAIYAPESHLMMRIPTVRVELREKPPGLMFPVFLLASYLAFLMIGVGFWHDIIFGIDSATKACIVGVPESVRQISCPDQYLVASSGSGFWPTILFGIPAIVSGWILSRFTPEAVSKLSISTISVTVWNLLNVVAAVALAAIKMTVLMAEHRQVFWVLPTTQPLWSLLTVSTLACAVMSLILLVLKIRRYNRRTSGKITNRRLAEYV